MKKQLAMIAVLVSASSFANDCELSINSTDQMQFDKKELSIPATCEEVKLTLNHTGKLSKNVMGHNWVLTKESDFQAVAQAGMSAGVENNYVPKGDARVVASTVVIGGGESTSITFSLKGIDSAETYKFFCSFPGHWSIMQGVFKVS